MKKPHTTSPLVAGALLGAVLLAVGMPVAGWMVYQSRSAASREQTNLLVIDNALRNRETHNNRGSVPLTEFSYTRLQMAMPLRITVWCDSENHAQRACKLAFQRAAELVDVFSDYDPESEISRLARSETGQPTKVSDPLLHVLIFAKQLNEKSDGAFDPTSAAVIQLWRDARKTGQLPDQQALDDGRSCAGFDKIRIDADNKTVTLLADGASFDFGGIAKGLIGDQVIEVLRRNGITIACYEAGGDIVVGDAPPGLNGWMIDVGQNEDGTVAKIERNNCGVSTSGDLHQFVEIDGKRYSHVVDPRTGVGVTTGRTAFAIAPTGMRSDALATTGCLLSEAEYQDLLGHFDDSRGWSTLE